MSELRGAILNGDAAAAVIAAKAALDAGVEPIDLVTEGIRACANR
jgi:methanogenic corrinoid protein MtbC1